MLRTLNGFPEPGGPCALMRAVLSTAETAPLAYRPRGERLRATRATPSG